MTEGAAGPIVPEEIGQTLEADERGFGSRMSPTFRQAILESSDASRTVASRDGSDIVGVAVSVPSEMTLPGLYVAPVAAVVGVAVWPTHRRQGRLRSMMRYQLDDVRARGEWVAVLTSSEAGIYQRFGYGPATLATWYTVESRRIRVEPPGGVASKVLADGEPAAGTGTAGRVRFVSREQAAAVFPGVLGRYQPTRAGEVARLPLGWLELLGEETAEEQRTRFFVTYEEGGEVLGYATYRIVVEERERRERVLKLGELCSLTPAAYVALWSYLVDVDLIDRIDTANRPVDEPIRWALSDYRRMKPTWTSEHTFVRLVDVGRALRERAYEASGCLTLAVTDRFCPWNEATYRLDVSDEGAVALDRVTTEPDLRLDVSALASTYLGGIRPSALAQVGLIEARDARAVTLADRLFVGPVPPYSTTAF